MQFDALGLSNESAWVDARVIKSAVVLSVKKPQGSREKRKIKAQMRKKTQRAMRFERDLDSDWTVKNKIPMFGMKECCCDVKWTGPFHPCFKASEHGHELFSYVVMKAFMESVPTVYADKGYC